MMVKGGIMDARKRSAKKRPLWEEQASHAATVLGVSESEMKRAVREALVRYAANTIVERRCRQLVEEACAIRIQDPLHDDNVARRVGDEKAWFPQD
jgi:hypothetical protein